MGRVFFALVLLFLGQGTFAELKPIPMDRLSQYKQALTISMNSQSFECVMEVGSPALSMENGISYSTFGYLDSDGAQPLLYFTYERNMAKVEVTVVTTADYQQIVSLRSVESYMTTVNKGDLRDPKITSEWKMKSAWSCVAK